MISVLQVLTVLVLLLLQFVVKRWLKMYRFRKALASWMPMIPQIPILGSFFELGDHTELLTNLFRFTDNPCKTCYGEVFGEPFVLTRDHDLLEFLLSSHKLINKSEDYRFLEPWLGHGLITSNGQTWKSHRKIITPAFHFSVLEQFVEVFNTHGDTLVQRLKNEALGEESVDIYKYVTACALDIICESSMGVNIHSQKNKNLEYVNAVKGMCLTSITRSFSTWKKNDFLFKFSQDYKRQCRYLKILHGFTNSVIEARSRKLNDERTDQKQKTTFLDLLLKSTINGKPLTKEEIREEVDTFMFAGHDTTSFAMSAAFYVLSKHPEVQKIIREEIKSVIGDDRNKSLTYQDLQELKYLDLVIKEVLRLYPSVPTIARELDHDVEFKGKIIPKDTVFSIFIYGINRDPDYHDDPELFKPERFLDVSSKKPYAYVPFSAGPRNCIGQKYAMLEMKALISKMLMHFEILLSNPSSELELAPEIILKAHNGVNVKLVECKW